MLVDYAHTPDSLENVLRAARALTGGRVLVRLRLPAATATAASGRSWGRSRARCADRAIVTSDNPRSEDPEAIVAEILAGIARRAAVEVDRRPRAAIERAVGLAGAGDVVVIAGKGHEQGQEFAGGRKSVRRRRPSRARRCVRDGRLSARRTPRRAARRARRRADGSAGPLRVTIDSRDVGPGDLFFGLPGRARRRRHASPRRRSQRARGASSLRPSTLTTRAARRAVSCSPPTTRSRALSALATRLAPRARREGRSAITGSTGKTSTKDILAAMLAPAPVRASPRAQTSTPRSACR